MPRRSIVPRLRAKARRLKREVHALWIATRDPRTPWYARAFAFGVVAYAASPIDLIPDFIPVLGFLDDVILLPLGIALAIRMIPPRVLAEARTRAREAELDAAGRMGAITVAAIWLSLASLAAAWAYRAFG